MADTNQILRGVSEVISKSELDAKIALGRQLVVKAGFDPTAPDLHLGHTVLLRKLRHFQEAGHKVIFLIGDATALVGDPTGQSKTRKLMTPLEIQKNARTYLEQVSKILLREEKVFQLEYNSAWFGRAPFGLPELIELTAKYTVSRILERDDFQKRLKAGQEVSMVELLYPLMQGYDSVQIGKKHSYCDVELGGTDQKFNLLVGRNLQRDYGQEPQVVITMPLLEGTDGVQKMSKSLGNHIGISESPKDIFGKLMSIPDGMITKYFTLLTDAPSPRIMEIGQGIEKRSLNPRDAKVELAATLVAMYHGQSAADQAKDEFFRVFSKRQVPAEMAEVVLSGLGPDGAVNVVDLMVSQGITKSKNEARRLLAQGGVKIDGVKIQEPVQKLEKKEHVFQVGSSPGEYRRLIVK